MMVGDILILLKINYYAKKIFDSSKKKNYKDHKDE